MVIDKFKQLNFIGDIWEPHYSSDSVYIAQHKINRSKLDIKLRFSKVSPTSEYAGDWFISRKKANSYRTVFDNNGMRCKKIPWSAFEPLEISKRSIYEL